MCIARKKRLWHPNAVYHVMGRGNRRQAIFRCKNDYLYFLDLLAHIQQKMPFEIYSYCLMTNHFHILIGTKNIVPPEIKTQYYLCKISLPLYLKLVKIKKGLFSND